MPLDQYVTLGRSGLRVSPFCLGAMTFGEDLGPGTGSSVAESERIDASLVANSSASARSGSNAKARASASKACLRTVDLR
jgi:hypothetical protein